MVYTKTLSTFVITLILIAGLVGCAPAPAPTQYNLTVSSTEGGSVTDPGEGTFPYDDGAAVDLAAEADEGYHFISWSGDVGTVADVDNATTTITMEGDYSIAASFARGPAIPLKNPGSYVQMTIGDVDSFDPAWGWDSASGEQVQYIYETLLFYDGEQTDQFVPVLATEWDLLDDNVTYRFKIRQGVKFHEGGNLTPEDVEYSFERAMVQDRDPGPAFTLFWSLLAAWGSGEVTFADIDQAVEVDGDWVVFHLCGPGWALPFLQIICGPVASIVDKEWCVANGEWDGTEETWLDYNHPQDRGDTMLFDKTNGTGPWRLEEWEPGVQMKLVRNDEYWRGPAAFGTVVTQIVEDWSTRKQAFLNGDADHIYVPRECVSELEGIADLNIYQDLPELSAVAFLFNFNITSDSEYIGSGALDGNGIPTDFFSDIDVRKGFCYAFDYETYIEDGFLGEAQQVGSPVCEGLPYFNPDASMYSLDLKKAEQHLKAAWGGEVWEKGFKFTLLYNIGSLGRETACEILAENLLAINPKFQVSIQPIALDTYRQMMRTRHPPMFPLGWIADYPHPDNFLLGLMGSYDFFAELQGYGYPELDELIKDAFEELDPAVQRDMYYELQERYYEDAPSIMLCQPLGRRYFTRYIQGFYYNPFIGGFALPLYYMSKSSS